MYSGFDSVEFDPGDDGRQENFWTNVGISHQKYKDLWALWPLWFFSPLQVLQFLRWAGSVMARFFPPPLCPAFRSRSATAALFWESPLWLPHTAEDFPSELPMVLDKPRALLNSLLQVRPLTVGHWWAGYCSALPGPNPVFWGFMGRLTYLLFRQYHKYYRINKPSWHM